MSVPTGALRAGRSLLVASDGGTRRSLRRGAVPHNDLVVAVDLFSGCRLQVAEGRPHTPARGCGPLVILPFVPLSAGQIREPNSGMDRGADRVRRIL